MHKFHDGINGTQPRAVPAWAQTCDRNPTTLSPVDLKFWPDKSSDRHRRWIKLLVAMSSWQAR